MNWISNKVTEEDNGRRRTIKIFLWFPRRVRLAPKLDYQWKWLQYGIIRQKVDSRGSAWEKSWYWKNICWVEEKITPSH